MNATDHHFQLADLEIESMSFTPGRSLAGYKNTNYNISKKGDAANEYPTQIRLEELSTV